MVDDEPNTVKLVTDLLRREGHEVRGYTSGQEALEGLNTDGPELVIVDLNLEKSPVQGLDVLQRARRMHPPAVVIVITAFGTVQTAVEAMKKGAFDYIEKPFKLDELRLGVQRALTYNQAVSENLYLRRQLRDFPQSHPILGASPAMQKVRDLIERVADTDSTVLILGESGTGKELVARALHFRSRRQFAPFIPINCSALPEALLESELFGHCKGAFTGALHDKKGLFQEADGGTILLDEIGLMPPLLQSRLLRVLQDREVRRVGDNTPLYVNVRVIAATNAPLEEKLKDGSFRQDLFYRLNVIPIRLPPLRERREDIPLLVAHYLKARPNPQTGQPLRMDSPEVRRALCAYDWPGNVRELQNVMERARVLCDGGRIELSDLPPALQEFATRATDVAESWACEPHPPAPAGTEAALAAEAPPPGLDPLATTKLGPSASLGSLKDFVREQELGYLARALAQTGGDKEKASQLLGISLATLYRKLAGEDLHY